jgi:hypothetical protein
MVVIEKKVTQRDGGEPLLFPLAEGHERLQTHG